MTDYSILGRAIESGIIDIQTYNIRDYGQGKRKQVDDTPFGGGAGMVLKADVMDKAIQKVKEENPGTKVILLTPKGEKYSQKKAGELSKKKNITLISGHYEGFDERIRSFVDEEVSIGDYILTGGELAAVAVVDSVSRLIPGVLGKEESLAKESFEENLLEYPQYTQPREYGGMEVPEILLSGNHAAIERWRREQAEKITRKRRKDLFENNQ